MLESRGVRIKTNLCTYGFATLVVSVLVFGGCRRASIPSGDYIISFAWQNDQPQVVELVGDHRLLSKGAMGEFRELCEPIIQNQLKKANLTVAKGTLKLTVEGDEQPYLTKFLDFKITVPDFTELSRAVQLQDTRAIREVVKKYGNINQRELPSMNTALNVAAAGGYVRSARSLLALGADANIPNEIGTTPLMSAVTAGNPAVIRLLVSSGADLKARDDAGDSAATLAKTLHREDLLPLLLPPRSE